MYNCTVYIDEAGDLGINRGTRWFALSAVIVNVEDEPAIRATIEGLRHQMNVRHIHFREIKNFSKKSSIVRDLSPHHFDTVNVVIDTSKLTLRTANTGDNPSFLTYNYAARILLERVSWLLRDTNRVGKVILSARGNGRDEDLISYLNRLMQNPEIHISNVFSAIEKRSASEWDLLQLADVCATSLFYAYEINQFGFREPCYIKRLESHFYKYNGRVANYGLKYYSAEMNPGRNYFNENLICK